jgi:hypothetical protein
MKCHGVYVCRGLRNPVQYLFDGGQEVIDCFLATSSYVGDFEEDVAKLDNRYIRIESPEIFDYLESVDGGLCGNFYTYIFEVDITLVDADDPFNKENIDSFLKIEFYEDKKIKHVFERSST